MAFRGRGRGRGFGGGNESRIANHAPFVEYPEDVTLPSLPSVELFPTEVLEMIQSKYRLEHFWKNSCYHLEAVDLKSKRQGSRIEGSSERSKQKTKREALASYLKLIPSNFPAELIQGTKHLQREKKKLRWDQEPDEKLFNMFEKLEENYKGGEGKEKEKEKGNESEDEEVEEEAEEESSDDDYNQNIDFDDDDDDMNMDDEGDEDVYE